MWKFCDHMNIDDTANLVDLFGSTKTFILYAVVLLATVTTMIIKFVGDEKRDRLNRESNRGIIKSLDMLVSILYEKNSNNVTIETARDIIDAQYSKSMYEIMSDVCHFIKANHIGNEDRQRVILDRLISKARNLNKRDFLILDKIRCYGQKLSLHIASGEMNPEEVAIKIFDEMMKHSRAGSTTIEEDVTAYIIDVYTRYINDAQGVVGRIILK